MSIVALSASFPGVSAVLEHGQELGLWKFVKLEGNAKLPQAGETALLGAWHPEYDGLVTTLQRMACKQIGVLWTSSVGEMGFEPSEVANFAKLLDDPRIDFIWVGEPSLDKIRPKVFYAPYPVKVENRRNVTIEKANTMTLFCPSTVKKNALNQLVAALEIQKKAGLQLYTNVAFSPGVSDILKDMRVMQSSWLPQAQYDQVLRRSKLALCVSWAETFSYQCAEGIMLGTPCVGSHTIPFLSDSYTVRDPNNPVEIAEVGLAVLAAGNDAAQVQYEALSDYAMHANARLMEILLQHNIR